ncbi:hypothetical protein FH039_04630 [Thermococcus indicus]|uniref:Uncharacterized protein n=1 Tax=Thermococcus indicus TaxID=2586643 RepID=A0A4Y5SJN3_9EURY|nr:hypothetical protein [Thermococcus indicus]QDA31026.1 hypothetical protein FH039_04630 [Thermococcus indicus]
MGGEELRFTGNWFVDAGILGFLNLMEEVYGWDLEELQKRINENREKVYYGYFPLAYFYNLAPRSQENKRILSQAIKEIETFDGDKHELLELIWWKYIAQLFTNVWIRKKLEMMHEKDLKNKSGKIKDPYNDNRYVEFVKKREELLNVVLKMEGNPIKEKKCADSIKKLIGKREVIKDGNHRLTLKDFEELIKLFSESSSPLNELLEECKVKTEEAIEIHKKLEEYLMKKWKELSSNSFVEYGSEKLKNSSKFYRLPIDSSFYHNYQFFNQSKGIIEQFRAFRDVLDGKIHHISRDVSKFLPSDNEFPNVSYTKFNIKPLQKVVEYLPVYLICVDKGMIDVNYSDIGKILFYGSDLKFAYTVNRKLKEWLKTLQDKNSIFRLTWRAVIDTIVETKSSYYLENMYIIQLNRNEKGQIIIPTQQTFVKVEYLGIPKLHASIILDDQIREALNTQMPIDILDKSKNKPKDKLKWSDFKKAWLLEVFISQRPMFPVVLRHSNFYLRIGKKPLLTSSLYALAIDAELRKPMGAGIFTWEFFERPKSAVSEIKEFYNDMQMALNVIKRISGQIRGKDILPQLFSALRRHNRNAFVNTLLKALLKANDKQAVALINSYLFKHVLNNDSSWEDFALALVIGLAGGGSSGES